jgi:hypothetical protein
LNLDKLANLENLNEEKTLPADRHFMGAIKFGAADGQKNVSIPLNRSLHHGRKPSMKVKQDALEVIQEKVREEDIAASIVTMHHPTKGQQIDPNEESYSFSLRNFPAGKINHSHGMKSGAYTSK